MYLVVEGYTDRVDDLEPVFGFLYSRVGNRADAEDLTQDVALKAWPRLREGASHGEVRAYLFATARSVLAMFWSERLRLPTAPIRDDQVDGGLGGEREAPAPAAEWLARTLATLPDDYRRVLEFRFLRGYSLGEVANEMGRSVGAVKQLQLRALRAAGAAPAMGVSPDYRPLVAAEKGVGPDYRTRRTVLPVVRPAATSASASAPRSSGTVRDT
jgi:RNA polymerase sigma factor (sigma-70 family)